jgi:acetyl esterase/lipase
MSRPLSRLLPQIILGLTSATWLSAESTDVRSFVYKKVGETELSLRVHYPDGWKGDQKRSAIVFFFGGGWVKGTVQQFEPQAKYLAARGMIAICADYRVKSLHNVEPDECVKDAKSAIRWVRQHCTELGVDPDKIVGAGGSAGGHLAACTALCEGLESSHEDLSISSRPNLLVLFNPPLNLNTPRILPRLGNDETLAKAISPTLHLKQDSPTALLLYGTGDELTAQGKEFVAKSQEVGHRAEIYLADDQKHGFFNRSPWRERTLERVDEFLVKQGYLTEH